MAPTGIIPTKDFRDQHRGAICADTSQLLKALGLVRAWKAGCFVCKGFLPGDLDLLQLRIQQAKALEASGDLLTEVRIEIPAIPCLHPIQLRSPVPAFQGSQMLDPMKREQSADPRNDLGSLTDQVSAFTHQPPGILLLRCRYRNQSTHTVISAEISFQNTDHRFGINPVGFDPFSPSRNEETRGIEHISVDAPVSKQSSKPEAVISNFKAESDSGRTANSGFGAGLKFADVTKQGLPVASRNVRQRHLARSWKQGGNKPRSFAQLDAHIDGRRFSVGNGCRHHDALSSRRRNMSYRPKQGRLHRIYYDLALEFGSENPADASVTRRVMTIMLAQDY